MDEIVAEEFITVCRTGDGDVIVSLPEDDETLITLFNALVDAIEQSSHEGGKALQ